MEVKYNKMKKELANIIEAAKKKYFAEKIVNCNGNSKYIWKTRNQIVTFKPHTKRYIKKLKLMDKTSTENTKLMADTLNEYFVNIGTNIAERITSTSFRS